MKKISIFLLSVCLLFSLCACGKEEEIPQESSLTVQETPNPVFEVKITMDNLYDYFEYKEFPFYTKDENSGDTTSVQIYYGFALKEGYTAANDPKKKDTLEITFTADGVVNSGEFQVDFNNLQYSGTTFSTERKAVSETLKFWPRGDRTTMWAFGNYSGSYILYLENFTVTSAKGSVFLSMKSE